MLCQYEPVVDRVQDHGCDAAARGQQVLEEPGALQQLLVSEAPGDGSLQEVKHLGGGGMIG